MDLSNHYLMAEDREEKPSFKTTNHLDFLCAEPANTYVPNVFDDGPLARSLLTHLRHSSTWPAKMP